MIVSITKKFIFILLSYLAVSTNVFTQCSVYIQMTDIGIEGCSLPVIVGTQQILLPCSTPDGFWDLDIGEFAYVDYELSGCSNFCQVGEEVNISCFSTTTEIKNDPKISKIKLYPTIAESNVFISGSDLQRVEIYDLQGRIVITRPILTSGELDISILSIGMYYIRVMTNTSFTFFPVMKI